MNIYDEIQAEREYQNSKGYTAEADDANNTIELWTTYVNNYASKWFPGGYPPYTAEARAAFRASMVKTAALAVAAIEWLDRQHTNDKGA